MYRGIEKVAHLILSRQESGFSQNDIHCRQWTHQNNAGASELTTSVLFSPILFFMHHPTSQPSSCFFTECTLGSCVSSARSWKWSWEKETHGQLVMLTSSVLPWEAGWKGSGYKGGHHQACEDKESFPKLRSLPSHPLSFPAGPYCLPSQLKQGLRNLRQPLWVLHSIQYADRPSGTQVQQCYRGLGRSRKLGVANITSP